MCGKNPRGIMLPFLYTCTSQLKRPRLRPPGNSGEVTFEHFYFLTFFRVTRDHLMLNLRSCIPALDVCVCVWGGGGGGGGGVPQEPGPNILMFEWYAMQVPKIHRAEWWNYWVTEIGTSFNGAGQTCERRRREPLGGVWGACPPPENFQIWKP